MAPVPPTTSRLIVKRGGKAITGTIPKPVILVDTREQTPLDLSAFPNWIGGVRTATLQTGDYTVEGFEDLICVERKTLNDLVATLMHHRARFIREMERLAAFPQRAIFVEASYLQVKSPYTFHEGVDARPNGCSGSLDAVEARWNTPVVYASSDRHLAAEKLASWLSKRFTYEYLERQGLGRVLQEGDL